MGLKIRFEHSVSNNYELLVYTLYLSISQVLGNKCGKFGGFARFLASFGNNKNMLGNVRISY